MSVEDVLKTVLRDKLFYANGGGVTLTGGEPMAQFPFALALAKAAKKAGISVVLETSGYAQTECFLEMTPFCDCFYFDCKADPALHSACTGVEDTLILQNLDAILRMDAAVVLRCPIVPGANLTEAYLDKIVALTQNTRTCGEFLCCRTIRQARASPSASENARKQFLLRPVRRRWRKSGTKFASASPFPYSDG
ncbi:MAG: hypothetical protein ACLTR4_04750 [Gallintestinimicrobium sp.]